MQSRSPQQPWNSNQTWNIREPSPADQKKYKNLYDLFQITEEWLDAIENSKYLFSLHPQIKKQIFSLNEWIKKNLNYSLKDQIGALTPTDYINEFFSNIWNSQAWTLKLLLKETIDDDKATTLNQLIHLAWRAGFKNFKKGPHKHKIEPSKNPSPKSKRTLQDVLTLLNDSAIANYNAEKTFLIKKERSNEIHAYFLSCPHQINIAPVQESANELCNIHFQWLKGFLYALDPRFVVTKERENNFCKLSLSYRDARVDDKSSLN